MSSQGLGYASGRALGLAAIALVLACGPSEPPPLPPGAHLAAQGVALRALLSGVAGLAGTPLGRQARELSLRLGACDTVVGRAPGGEIEELLAGLACVEELPAAIARELGDAELFGLFPIGPSEAGRRLALHGSRKGDGLVFEARIDPSGLPAAAALLLPSGEPAGPPVLAVGGAVIHARVRPRGGLDLSALVPEGGQADRLFRMKSALFSGAVLGGVWEVAAYLPRPGNELPPMALALDVRRQDLAVNAMEEFITELTAAWPVHRTPARFPGPSPREGACLFDLRILPGFAPCYVATERALVVAWNPASLERALAAGEAAPQEALEGTSRLSVRLDRLAEADRQLQATRGLAAGTERTWGWRGLEIAPAAEGDGLHIELTAAEPAG